MVYSRNSSHELLIWKYASITRCSLVMYSNSQPATKTPKLKHCSSIESDAISPQYRYSGGSSTPKHLGGANADVHPSVAC